MILNELSHRRGVVTATTTTTTTTTITTTTRSYQHHRNNFIRKSSNGLKRRRRRTPSLRVSFASSSTDKEGKMVGGCEFGDEGEETKRRRKLARDLVRNLLDASSSVSNNNEEESKSNKISVEGCEHIPCERPPLSLLSGSMELTYRERPVPDVENAFMHKCQLVSSPSSPSSMARRFRCRKANKYIAHLFSQIAKHSGGADIQLSRFDLFHAHIFKDKDVVGILFHAKEYCRFDENAFNVNLGYCQQCSHLEYDAKKMEKRNILWVASLKGGGGGGGGGGEKEDVVYSMAVLDTSYHSELLFPGQSDFHTIHEGDFGDILGDVFYFDALKNRKPQERVIVASSTKS